MTTRRVPAPAPTNADAETPTGTLPQVIAATLARISTRPPDSASPASELVSQCRGTLFPQYAPRQPAERATSRRNNPTCHSLSQPAPASFSPRTRSGMQLLLERATRLHSAL